MTSLAKWLSVRLRTKWFWVRVQLQSLNLNDEQLKRKHFLRILHFILGAEFPRFIFQNYFESSILFLYTAKLKYLLCSLYFFKYSFRYTYINVLAVGLFIACDGGFKYRVFSAWQFPFSEQSSFLMQLPFCSFGHRRFWCKTFLLWLLMIAFMFFCTTVVKFYCVLRKILCSLCCREKCLSNNFKK